MASQFKWLLIVTGILLGVISAAAPFAASASNARHKKAAGGIKLSKALYDAIRQASDLRFGSEVDTSRPIRLKADRGYELTIPVHGKSGIQGHWSGIAATAYLHGKKLEASPSHQMQFENQYLVEVGTGKESTYGVQPPEPSIRSRLHIPESEVGKTLLLEASLKYNYPQSHVSGFIIQETEAKQECIVVVVSETLMAAYYFQQSEKTKSVVWLVCGGAAAVFFAIAIGSFYLLP